MRLLHETIAGTVGAVLGLAVGAGAVTMFTGEAAAPVASTVRHRVAPAADLPEQPDRLVPWLKAHPR